MGRNQVDPEELRNPTEVFRDAGADEPELWAHSQLAEGIPQLAIFSFAKALWNNVLSEDDDSWVDNMITNSQQRPDEPCAQAGFALSEMIDKGVSRETITDFARVLQYDTLFGVCSLIDGATEAEVPISHWLLHQVDDEGTPVAIIQVLHEVLLGMDPTGREMMPRPNTQ